MTKSKVCTNRKTKSYPNVYLVSELRKLAKSKGLKTKNLDKAGLCKALGIKWKGQDKKVNTLDGRDCLKIRSKLNPNAFTKIELVTLVTKNKLISKSNANSLTKPMLCGVLKKHKIIIPKRNPTPIKFNEKAPPKKKKKTPLKFNKKAPPKKKKTPLKFNKKAPPKKKKTPLKFNKEAPSKKKKKTPLKFNEKTPPKKKNKGVKGVSPKKKAKVPLKFKDSSKNGDCIQRSNIPLKKHQVDLVTFLKNHRGVIAAFDVGTGKTLTAVAAIHCFLENVPKGEEAKRSVYILTPKSLQDNFKKEILAYGSDPTDKRYHFLTIGKFRNTFLTREFPPNAMLVVDEAHNLRNNASGNVKSRSAVIARCAIKAKKVLLLTATPLYNSKYDIISLVAMVKGKKVSEVMKDFNRVENSGSAECNYFRDTMMFFASPKSKDYPTFKEHEIHITMSKAYYKNYRKVELKRDHLFNSSAPFAFLTVVRQATNAFSDCQKCSWVIDKIKEGEKTIVYSAFLTHGLSKLKDMLKKEKISYVEVTGKLSQKERSKAVEKYNANKVKVMFISKAGGEGLDLKETRNIIMLESLWNRPNEEQIMGRAIRYKSHANLPKNQQHVDVYHLYLVKPSRKVGEKESADIILKDITERKARENANFLNLLKTVAIDVPKGTKCPPPNYIFE